MDTRESSRASRASFHCPFMVSASPGGAIAPPMPLIVVSESELLLLCAHERALDGAHKGARRAPEGGDGGRRQSAPRVLKRGTKFSTDRSPASDRGSFLITR